MSQKKKNAFFHYMQKRKYELTGLGEVFPNGLKDVATRVSQEWQAMSLLERRKYDIDKKGGLLPHPSNAIGLPLPSTDSVRKDETLEFLKKNVSYLLYANSAYITDMVFILMDFNPWCRDDMGEYIPAEIGLVAFSLSKGVVDEYGTLIDMGKVQLGLGVAVNKTRDELYLPDPPFFEASESDHTLKNLIHTIFQFMNKYSDHISSGYLFCRTKKIPVVNSCLNWILVNSKIEYRFELYSVEDLVMKLSAADQPKSSEPSTLLSPTSSDDSVEGAMSLFTAPTKKTVYTTEFQVDRILESLTFAGNIHFGCFHHMENWAVVHKCSLGKLNRYAYLIIGALVENFGIQKIPSVHYPCEDNTISETNKRVSMLSAWGLEKIYYPTFKTPEERDKNLAIANARIAANTAHRSFDLNDQPLALVPTLFRDKPLASYKVISARHEFDMRRRRNPPRPTNIKNDGNPNQN